VGVIEGEYRKRG